MNMAVHPLEALSVAEINVARDVVLESHPGTVVSFREIFLQEPPKAELLDFLDLEHAGHLSPTSPRPNRLARAQYDVIGAEKIPASHESVIDVESRRRVSHEILKAEQHASLTQFVTRLAGEGRLIQPTPQRRVRCVTQSLRHLHPIQETFGRI